MKEIRLLRGQITRVSDEDFDFLGLFKWHMQSNGYVRTKIHGRAVLMHRLIMNTPKGMDTDHINHDKLDNQRSNLRICTRKENLQNKGFYKPRATSGMSGVSWVKNVGKWQVRFQINNNRKVYGYYQDKSEAIAASKLIMAEV